MKRPTMAQLLMALQTYHCRIDEKNMGYHAEWDGDVQEEIRVTSVDQYDEVYDTFIILSIKEIDDDGSVVVETNEEDVCIEFFQSFNPFQNS